MARPLPAAVALEDCLYARLPGEAAGLLEEFAEAIRALLAALHGHLPVNVSAAAPYRPTRLYASYEICWKASMPKHRRISAASARRLPLRWVGALWIS